MFSNISINGYNLSEWLLVKLKDNWKNKQTKKKKTHHKYLTPVKIAREYPYSCNYKVVCTTT